MNFNYKITVFKMWQIAFVYSLLWAITFIYYYNDYMDVIISLVFLFFAFIYKNDMTLFDIKNKFDKFIFLFVLFLHSLHIIGTILIYDFSFYIFDI